MNYLELSIEDLKKEIEILNSAMSKMKYKPDRIVFVSKGAYLIGKYLSDMNNIPLIECHAKRQGNKLKSYVAPSLKILPQKLKVFLRKLEINKGTHTQKSERNVFTNINLTEKDWLNEKILIVDDSVDTGNTLKQVKDYLLENSGATDIKILAINVFHSSNEIITVDYYIYKDTMINGPWSNDSKYNKQFLLAYEKGLKEGVFL
ncbi:MAG: phosphoribosyltransferase [Solibacillus sp.]